MDVVAFSALDRDEIVQLELRHAMYATVQRALAMTCIPWQACHAEDRGDGILVVLPPEIPGHLLLDPLANHLSAMLRQWNLYRSDVARLRMRVAVTAGPVRWDEYGVSGRVVIELFRLLEAPSFKEAIDLSGSDLGLLAGERLFEDVVCSGPYVEQERYRAVQVACKETKAVGWLWLSRSGAVAA